ncbi:MAG: hypothetical protein ACI8PT_004337 [Gammaproteobacteria bacterium]
MVSSKRDNFVITVAQIDCPFIIDVEASGFGPYSYPIEVGLALDGGQRYSTLIKPPPQWTHWDESAENTHHISRDVLNTHGKAPIAVAREINARIEGKTVYSDGWVVDKPWLVTLFHAAQTPMAFFVSPLELILNDAQMSCWHATKDRILGEDRSLRHRASYDAWIIQRTYQDTRENS